MNDFVTTSTTEEVAAVAPATGTAPDAVENKSAQAAPAENAPARLEEKPVESETAEEDGESEQDEDAEEQSRDAEQPRKKRGGFKRRIDKLNGRLTAVEQEKEYWREQALKLQKPEPAQGGAKTPIAQDGRPTQDAFDTHEEYLEALTDWKVDQRDRANQAKATEQSQKSAFDEKVQSYQAKVKEFAKTHDDFDDVLESVGDIPMSIAVQQSLLESEIGPEIAYELAKNPGEYERICSLGLVPAARELGKIEAKLLAEKSKPPVESKTTKAPKPVAPVSTKNAGSIQKSPDEMDFEEFKAWRKKSMKG